jgi:DNA polymerase
MNQMTNKWEVQKLYGAKLTENIVQAIARDCLAHVLVFAEIQGLRPVFHVHDEVVCEVAERQALQDYQRLLSVMKHPAQWTEGLPLGGDGFVSEYYKK